MRRLLSAAAILLAVVPFLRGFAPESQADARAGAGENRRGPLALLLAVISVRSIAWYGLMALERSLRQEGSGPEAFQVQLEWLIQHAISRRDGGVVWTFPVDVQEGECRLQAPWISAMTRRAKSSGATVSDGASGETLVSMLNRTDVLPRLRTIAKRSARRGMRVPSTATCSGRRPTPTSPTRTSTSGTKS